MPPRTGPDIRSPDSYGLTSNIRYYRCVPFYHLWRDLRIVSLCRRYVNVENGISRYIDQQRRPQLLNGEIRSLRVVS